MTSNASNSVAVVVTSNKTTGAATSSSSCSSALPTTLTPTPTAVTTTTSSSAATVAAVGAVGAVGAIGAVGAVAAAGVATTNTPTSMQQQQQHVTPTTRTMQSDEDFNIRFVNLVRQHKCLYDKKVPEYRNRDNQEKSWALISQETRESVIHCKERWRNLRACLSRYIKQQNGSDPQHKPYYLTEHMAFLLPFLKSTRNSLDGNNSFATLYQYSQRQQQEQQHHHHHHNHHQHQQNLNETPNSSLIPSLMSGLQYNDPTKMEMKHSLSDHDEETIDAFDPAVTAAMQQTGQISPALSDTASANTLQNFIPDVQIAESAHDINYHTHNENSRRGCDFSDAKRIKTECEATTTAPLHLYSNENSDMEFFRSILPDIAALTPQQKRKFKIGILELIDDVADKYPENRNAPSSSSSSRVRHNSTLDWHK